MPCSDATLALGADRSSQESTACNAASAEAVGEEDSFIPGTPPQRVSQPIKSHPVLKKLRTTYESSDPCPSQSNEEHEGGQRVGGVFVPKLSLWWLEDEFEEDEEEEVGEAAAAKEDSSKDADVAELWDVDLADLDGSSYSSSRIALHVNGIAIPKLDIFWLDDEEAQSIMGLTQKKHQKWWGLKY